MERIYLSKCLNKPVRIMGSSFFGVIGGGIAMCLMWILFSMPIGIFSFVGGYALGRIFGIVWHKGKLQRWIYWYLPSASIVGGKNLPKSHERRFF
jgi:uncharacterized membrane protein SpoIIM required for sporulation